MYAIAFYVGKYYFAECSHGYVSVYRNAELINKFLQWQYQFNNQISYVSWHFAKSFCFACEKFERERKQEYTNKKQLRLSIHCIIL